MVRQRDRAVRDGNAEGQCGEDRDRDGSHATSPSQRDRGHAYLRAHRR
jgi:hypothetical protein